MTKHQFDQTTHQFDVSKHQVVGNPETAGKAQRATRDVCERAGMEQRASQGRPEKAGSGQRAPETSGEGPGADRVPYNWCFVRSELCFVVQFGSELSGVGR